MRAVRVGGIWLHSIGPYADVTTSHIWPHGDDEASWRMRPTTSHPVLSRGGALVEVFNGGRRCWRGHLTEPGGSGEYHANGSWSEATGVYAINSSGDATNDLNEAVDVAIAAGKVSWTRPASLKAAPWGDSDQPLLLTELLDKGTTGQGLRWWVDPDGKCRVAPDPTTPSYYVPHAAAGHGLTLAEDTYYSHLVGQYLATGPVYKTVTVGNASAAAWFGYKEGLVDLTGAGVIDVSAAIAELNGRLALVGARMGFAENLTLGKGEITRGGVPVPLTMPTASSRYGGVMFRLQGVRDRTRPGRPGSSLDIVISKSVYTDGAATGVWTPMGMADRDLAAVLSGSSATEF
jgi:hypothetical protein